MISSGRRSLGALALQVLHQPVLRPLHDVAGQAFVQRARHAALLLLAPLPAPEVRGERGHRIVAPVEEQVLRQLHLFRRNAVVALQPLRVDDGEVQAGLRREVQVHGVQDLAAGGRQPEAHIGDPEDRLGARELLLQEGDRGQRLLGGAQIVLVARPDREHQRIPDDVLGRHAVLLREQTVAAAGDLHLPLARDAHALHGILVDGSDDDGRAVALEQRTHGLEALLAVLQVDGVDDGLALAPLQRVLDGDGVRAVDHDGHADHADELLVEALHVRHLVAVRVLQVHVHHLRAAAHLAPRDLRGLLEPVLLDQPFELPRADDVGALADVNGADVVVHLQEVDAGRRWWRAGPAAGAAWRPARDRGRTRRCGPAACQQQPPMTV